MTHRSGGEEKTVSGKLGCGVYGLTHRDGALHLAIFSGVIGSVSQQPQLAFFRYKPAGEFSVPVSHSKGRISLQIQEELLVKENIAFVHTVSAVFIRGCFTVTVMDLHRASNSQSEPAHL